MTAMVVAAVRDALPVDSPSWRVLAALGAMARRGLRFRLRCLILGHDDVFARQPRRLMLRCATCGRETVGWPIGRGPADITSAQRAPAGPRPAVIGGPVRLQEWTLGLWERRREIRDRQRRRLVAAASRAGLGK